MLGELLGGFMLGPSVLGALLPGLRAALFENQGGGVALSAFSWVGAILLLFVVATLVKAGGAMLGARLGGLGGWEAAVVGLGINLKGGADVIVAILGAELGLLSARAYAMYAVVAILTVLVMPPLLNALRGRTPPSAAELERLNREEARGRAYLPRIERALVPLAARLFPERVAPVLDAIARAKGGESEFFDITRLALDGRDRDRARPTTREADAARETASRLDGAER